MNIGPDHDPDEQTVNPTQAVKPAEGTNFDTPSMTPGETKVGDDQAPNSGDPNSGDPNSGDWSFDAEPLSKATASAVELPEVPGHRMIRRIGRGGMGEVFLAEQIGLGRAVAVKTIRAELVHGEKPRRRFLAEAEAAASLAHDRIVSVIASGHTDRLLYFTMPLVSGGDLRQHVVRGDLSPHAAASMVYEIAQGVAYAHSRGIVHRDLKPGNILLDDEGRPKIADFGLAKVLGSMDDMTQTGQAIGTPSYMPPEQASGQGKHVGHGADVYALGAILYALLCGRPPFQSDSSVRTLKLVVEQLPVAPRQWSPDVPRDLEVICLKCLEKDPARRYLSVNDLAEDLNRFVQRRPILAKPPRLTGHALRWCQRNPSLAASVAALAMAMILGTSVSLYYGSLATRRASRLTELNEVLKAATLQAEQSAQESKAAMLIASNNSNVALDAMNTVVGSINGQLESSSMSSETRRSILKQVFVGLDDLSTDLLDQSAVDRTTVLTNLKLAEVYRQAGSDDEETPGKLAEAHFNKAIEISRKLCERENDSPKSRAVLAYALEAYSMYFFRAGRLDRADPLIKETLALREIIAANRPDDKDIQFELAMGLNDYGNLLVDRQKADEAIPVFERMSEILIKICVGDDLPLHFRQAQASCFHALASIAQQQNDFPASIANLLLAYDVVLELAADYPNDPRSNLNVAEIQTALGNVNFEAENFGEAELYFRSSIDAHQKGIQLNPDRVDLPEYLCESQVRLAETLSRLGQTDESFVILIQAVPVLKDLCANAPQNVWVHGTLADGYELLATMAYRSGDKDDAAEYLDNAIKTLSATPETRNEFDVSIVDLQTRLAKWLVE